MWLRNTRLIVFGLGLAWEAISLVLPPIVSLPLLLVGLVILVWALYPVRVQNFLGIFPVPVQSGFFFFIKSVESFVEDTDTQFVTREGEESGDTYIVFSLTDGLYIEEGNNVNSITDNGAGDYTVNFSHPIKDTYFVNVLHDTNVDHEIVSKTSNGFRIKIRGDEPEQIGLNVNVI